MLLGPSLYGGRAPAAGRSGILDIVDADWSCSTPDLCGWHRCCICSAGYPPPARRREHANWKRPQRVQKRGDAAETTGAEAMYDQFADLGDFEPHVISSDAPAERVIEACRAALADGILAVRLDP